MRVAVWAAWNYVRKTHINKGRKKSVLKPESYAVISYVFNLNAKWPIKSWSTSYKKKSSFNFVKFVKKKIFYQNLTFFHPNLKMLNRYDFASSRFGISGPNTSRNDKNIPCSPHFHLSWQFCRTIFIPSTNAGGT